MKKEHAQEIIECLPSGRTPFHYHRDRYAIWLLANRAGPGCSVNDLKRSNYSRLLHKPLIREMIADRGNGIVNAQDFSYLWMEPSTTFMLTLATWGGRRLSYYQTTRKGFNLVLQLNFSNQHNGFFHANIDPDWQDDFRYRGHPILKPGERRFEYETLAWSRLDIDLQTGEALIEEIQNDWLRFAKRWQRCADAGYRCKDCPLYSQRRQVSYYLDRILKPYIKLWDEAMLAATLRFLLVELGITHIYYHTHESGNHLKSIRGRKPPRSIYTDLPRQFCFETTPQAPTFLLQDRSYKKRLNKIPLKNPTWQHLQLEKHHAWT